MTKWDHEFDFVVVGSGGGGMTSALVAKINGLDSIVLEKTEYYGGSTSLSGGGIWVPGNYLMDEAGIPDSIENGITYLEHTVGDRVPAVKREMYVTKANEMLLYMTKHSRLKFHIMQDYPDYYPEMPGSTTGGRALEPLLFTGRKLGRMHKQMRPHPYLVPGIVFTLDDWLRFSMVRANPATFYRPAWFFLRNLFNVIFMRKHVTLGMALVGRLRMSLYEHEVPVWLNSALTDLVIEDGRVTGVEIEKNGIRESIRARKGVVLATGGFPKNREMREKYFKKPTTDEWTSACPGNTGDAINIGMKAGAAVDLMDDAWWGPTSLIFGGPPLFLVFERSYPGAIIVDSKGKRFVNESAPYIEVVHAMYDKNSNDTVAIPSHFIMDHRFRSKYFFGLMPPGMTPKKMIKQGHVLKAKSLEELASQAGIDPEGLAGTVASFNEFVRAGKDKDFKRGDSVYDRFYGDHGVKPNPCLAPLDKPPYYATKIYPGDLGTKGGLATDEYAQVLKEDGAVISGLYAIGNTSSSVMGTSYPGPGATIGPAMTFGYVAALHAAKK